MTRKSLLLIFCCVAASASLVACKRESDANGGAPPTMPAAQTGDMSLFSVDKPDQFPLVSADSYEAKGTLNVTGTVNPDIAREIPVISLASGRVVEIWQP